MKPGDLVSPDPKHAIGERGTGLWVNPGRWDGPRAVWVRAKELCLAIAIVSMGRMTNGEELEWVMLLTPGMCYGWARTSDFEVVP